MRRPHLRCRHCPRAALAAAYINQQRVEALQAQAQVEADTGLAGYAAATGLAIGTGQAALAIKPAWPLAPA